MKYAHIASKILSRPLMLEPGYASVFFSAFGARAGFESLVHGGVEVDMKKTAESYQVRANRFGAGSYKPYAIMNGVAVVSVEGSLVHKTGNLDPESGMQGYDGIRAKLDMAMQDDRVKGVMLNIDSPGGEVSGAFDLADTIAGYKKKKKIAAYAGDMMASAAYLIGSQAVKVYASQTASVGSIGVLMAHTDYSVAMENEGIKVTLIHSGKHKVEGNPYQSLDSKVKDKIQGELDGLREKFAAAVATGRKKSKEDMMATEAAIYSAEEAVSVGLVDSVMSFDQAIADFSNGLSLSGGKTVKGKQMSEKLDATPGMIAEAEVEKLMLEARAEGVKAGAAQERARIQAILGEEASGREATAKHLAFGTDMAAEAAVAVLQSVPKMSVAGAAGMTEGAGVKAEAEMPQLSESEKAAQATKAAIAALLKK
jgi:signal peptide peptidase SppA